MIHKEEEKKTFAEQFIGKPSPISQVSSLLMRQTENLAAQGAI